MGSRDKVFLVMYKHKNSFRLAVSNLKLRLLLRLLLAVPVVVRRLRNVMRSSYFVITVKKKYKDLRFQGHSLDRLDFCCLKSEDKLSRSKYPCNMHAIILLKYCPCSLQEWSTACSPSGPRSSKKVFTISGLLLNGVTSDKLNFKQAY